MNRKAIFELFMESDGIATDSRSIRRGQLYFALKGERFDGNLFAESALENGAKCAIIDDPKQKKGDVFILVKDVLKTLQSLAEDYRNYLSVKVIGITGTNGKTTTKELLNKVLSARYKVHATSGNLNNHIGVPLTLLSAPQDTQVLIVEMGANHPGEIAELCSIAHPDIGYITNIGNAHLEGFGEINQIFHTKKALFDAVEERKTGCIFINLEDARLRQLDNKYEGCSVRIGGDSKLHTDAVNTKQISCSPYLTMQLQYKNISYECSTHLIGCYNKMNVLAALEIGRFLGVTLTDGIEAIGGYTPSQNRSELKRLGRFNIIMDAYNANPSSMREAIENFFQLPGKDKVMVLGDMLELGEEEYPAHQEIADLIAQKKSLALYYGPRFGKVNLHGQRHFEDVRDLTDYLSAMPGQELWILLKGSRGMRLERVLEQLH